MWRFSSILRDKWGKWIFALVIVIAVAAIVTARGWIGSVISPSVSNNPSSQPGNVEVEIVTVRPWGFEPKEINRRAGPFFLAVDNHSELSDIDVSLNQESGPRLNGVGVTKNKRKWRQKLTLPPGTYVLREANHPEWTCRITIEP